ncbi:hypothetical protein GGX14DRAFT_369008, partial [Mycena pura]
CPGLAFSWVEGDLFDTYPFHLHSSYANYPARYNLISVHPPIIRSKICRERSTLPDVPCHNCADLKAELVWLEDNAKRDHRCFGRTDDLNYVQLREKLTDLHGDNVRLRSKVHDLEESLAAARQRENQFIELHEYLAKEDVPALHRMFPNAAKFGWGTGTFLEKCRQAVAGKYTPRNFSEDELKLGVVIYIHGGEAALTAWAKLRFAGPSRNTIAPYIRAAQPLASINGPQEEDVLKNIGILFGEDSDDSEEGVEERFLWNLSFDEMAIDPKVEYYKNDTMSGLCTKHRSALQTVKVGDTTDNAKATVCAVRDGHIHVGKEVSVGAISRLSETKYGAQPIQILASCKSGTAADVLRAMEIPYRAWNLSPDRAAKRGPIRTISTDGDSKRCIALHAMCLHTQIVEGNPLWEAVQELCGLNLFVGIRTDICSATGIVVNSVSINRDMVFVWFECLTDHDWSEMSIVALLHPKDAQDVSSAIRLMLTIIENSALDPASFNPDKRKEFDVICLFARFLDALLQPMINIQLSLSRQIESWALAAKLCCVLYIQHETDFMPNQLYYDLQTMFKNGFLLVPKTRLLGDEKKVFICLVGDNVLETLFGRIHMIGGHAPNCTLLQWVYRSASARVLDRIYEQYPLWEKKPPRLKMQHSSDLDHLRPAHWKDQNLRADSCDLAACWHSSDKTLDSILKQYNIRMSVPLSERFHREDTDLMCPFGGKYPGVSSAEPDRSLGEESSNLANALRREPITNTGRTVSPRTRMSLREASEASRERENVRGQASESHSQFAIVNDSGRLVHKKSLLTVLFEMIHDLKASHDRLLRVRDVALAVAKCTLIKNGSGTSVNNIPIGELTHPENSHKISGQVYGMVYLPASQSMPARWISNGEFISFDTKRTKNAKDVDVSRLRNLQITVPMQLVEPAQCKAVEISLDNTEFDGLIDSGLETTWQFLDEYFHSIWHTLWQRLLENQYLHTSFPKFTGILRNITYFPYHIPSTSRILCSHKLEGTAIAQSLLDSQQCFVCHKTVKFDERQDHMGRHILCSMYGVNSGTAFTTKYPIVGDYYPCGFCGRSTDLPGSCVVEIKSGLAVSNCPSYYRFSIASAKKYTDKHPSTNVPIQCTLGCSDSDKIHHWKYNFHRHLMERHPGWENSINASLRSQLAINVKEQLMILGKGVDWPPPIPCAGRPNPPDFSPPQPLTQKRLISTLLSPTHQRDKENHNPVEHRPKIPRLQY